MSISVLFEVVSSFEAGFGISLAVECGGLNFRPIVAKWMLVDLRLNVLMSGDGCP